MTHPKTFKKCSVTLKILQNFTVLQFFNQGIELFRVLTVFLMFHVFQGFTFLDVFEISTPAT